MKRLAVLLLLAGCGQKIEITPAAADAGLVADGGAETADGADAAAPGGDDAGNADVLASDSGPPGGTWAWTPMILPADTRTITAIIGRASDDVLAGTINGRLLAFDGAAWTERWRTPSNHGIDAIGVVGDALFIGAGPELWTYDGNDFTRHVVRMGRKVTDVLAFATDDVYLTVEQTTGTALFRWDGAALSEVWTPNGVGTLYSVWGPSPAELYISGSQGSLHKKDGAAVFEETVEFPATWDRNDIAIMQFRSVRGIGGALFAVGSRHLVFRKGADQIWHMEHEMYRSDLARAIAGRALPGGGLEIFVAGTRATEGPLQSYLGGNWAFVPNLDDDLLYGLWTAGDGVYYAGGSKRSASGGVVLIGERR